MKINFWCGRHVLDGWLNVDAVSRKEGKQPELIHAMDFKPDGSVANPLPLPDCCAEELQAIHAFEHVFAWQARPLIREWKRLLAPDGLLVLELPNLIKCCQNYIDGRAVGGKNPDQLARWGIFGDPHSLDPYMNHRWGYSPDEMISILQDEGFRKVVERPTKWHPAGREHRDMRIEARKP